MLNSTSATSVEYHEHVGIVVATVSRRWPPDEAKDLQALTVTFLKMMIPPTYGLLWNASTPSGNTAVAMWPLNHIIASLIYLL